MLFVPNIIRFMKWKMKCAEDTECVGKIINAYKFLIEYLDGRAFGRHRRVWKY